MLRNATVIILLGPPGAGKGTQAERLSSSLGIPSISTGEILRQECRSGSALGKLVQAQIEAGQLVKDELMQEVITHRLAKPDCAHGCILDGFPRTAAQARFLDRTLDAAGFPPPVVFDLSIEWPILIPRLSSRRQCPQCARTFHVVAGASTACPIDGAELIIRSDDQPDTIRRRLEIYANNTSEIVRFYQNRGYHKIDASQPVDEIAEKLMSLLQTPVVGQEFSMPVARQRLFA